MYQTPSFASHAALSYCLSVLFFFVCASLSLQSKAKWEYDPDMHIAAFVEKER
jgi:hypothetical protein